MEIVTPWAYRGRDPIGDRDPMGVVTQLAYGVRDPMRS